MKRMMIVFIVMSFILFAVEVGTTHAGTDEEQGDYCLSKETKNYCWWVEIWGEDSYRSSNFSIDTKENKEKNFHILTLNPKAGLRFNLFDAVWYMDEKDNNNVDHFYLEPYIKAEIVQDFGDKTWNNAFWSNFYTWGVGARLRYIIEPGETTPLLEHFNIDLYGEYLNMEDSIINGKKDIAGNVPDQNIKFGVNSWLSVKLEKAKSSDEVAFNLWGEMWSDFTYGTTNFYQRGLDNYYILLFQPKIGASAKFGAKDGIHISLEPYIKLDFAEDFGKEDWNKQLWSNNTTYGPGLRLVFDNYAPLKSASVKLFAETLSINYPERIGSKADGRADSDFRAGINIWLPLGSSSWSKGQR